jgi:hypothetical protein
LAWLRRSRQPGRFSRRGPLGIAAAEIWAAPDFIAHLIAQDHFEVGLSV